MMSRLVILMLFFYLFSSQPSPTAADSCDIRRISECWINVLSKYCLKTGFCFEEPDYCKDEERLTDCISLNCGLSDIRKFTFAKLFPDNCNKNPMAIPKDD